MVNLTPFGIGDSTKNIIVPYIENDTHIGYLTYPKNSNLVLRYYDMNNLLWNTRIARDAITISSDILDENKKIKGISWLRITT
jgi:hypothetical protein